MIGVLFDAAETAAVAEFFQLFKTPWEPYTANHPYDVVISSIDPGVEIKVPLLILFGSKSYSSDLSPVCDLPHRPVSLVVLEGNNLPLYGELLAFENTQSVRPCAFVDERMVGFRRELSGRHILRLGYNVFQEVDHLLSHRQPLEYARIPTLDLHIEALRRWILEAGISFVEIPPVPVGTSFIVCLTHDIDFVGIRNHRLDHTMFGFVFRATLGALLRFIRGRIGLRRLLRSWVAVVSLPLVYFGWRKDFWVPFEWYLHVEKDLGATYYFIPFKGRNGNKLPAGVSSRRAAAYDLSDLSDWIRRLQEAHCEIGVHGIDAWHDLERAKEERAKVASLSGADKLGVRMHWLLGDQDTPRILDEAGYEYDSTAGYNEDVGYHSGTNQVYQPRGVRRLLELPLHIQDGTLFYPQRLDLSEASALELCAAFMQHALKQGGVLTILWHDRSFGPERFWGEFYIGLIAMLKQFEPWFATARETVDWFRARRLITFERHTSAEGKPEVVARCGYPTPSRAFAIKIHHPSPEESTLGAFSPTKEVAWTGTETTSLTALLGQRGVDNSATEVFRDNRSGSAAKEARREALPIV